ncbi:TonB-dependent siderophore receptor [Duganella sp. FT80W]|uniref:TonB-dependent siderophore receptor n=1 Tax=Duganella guangzhouensis TaxID=2666084 RepID=A0A6I2KW67_9BURK|nr:TonB-dependent siderophore receptor [Duganella guangzhouensis]MRW88436.1 TonB-dependent siderophore receptor [Duganella guangzhouensis]
MINSYSGVRRRRISLLVSALFAAAPQAFAAEDAPVLPATAAAASTAAATAATEADATTVGLATVTVAAERESEAKKAKARGALGDRSDLETPFATATVTSAQIQDRQIASLAQVFVDDPSVSAKGSTYTQSSYAVSVRGLTLDFTNGYKIDGQPFQMYGVELPLEAFESVQLLKGATGFLYGFAAPGGIINYVTKKPTDERLFSADIGYTDSGIWREHVDVGGRFGEDNRFGYRANVSHEEGDTYNGAGLKRNAVALALDARLSQDITLSGGILYQERDLNGGVPTISLQAYPAASGLPKPVAGDTNYGAYASTYYDSTMWMGTSAVDWRINNDWKANLTYGHTFKRIDSSIESLYLTNQNGAYSNRLNPYYRPTLTYNALNLTVDGAFNTGTIKHHVVFGAGRQGLSRTLNYQSALSLYSAATVGNLYQAPPVLVDTSVNDRRIYTISTYTQKSLFASDTIDFNQNWSLLAGARYVNYENLNYNTAGASTSAYNKKPTTPTVALLFHPTTSTTIYGSYVEALEDGGTVSTTYANANEALAPLKSRQAELGVKTDRSDWGASAALFRVRRGAAYADYSTNPQGIYVQGGELRYQGLELNGHADLQRWLTVNAGATWLDAKYRNTTPTIIGNRVESTPRFQAVLGADLKVPQIAGFSLHADASYIGNEAANSANNPNWLVPAYTLLNAGASYRSRVDGHYLTYRLQVNNLADRSYWYSTASNALQIGAPRQVSLNLSFEL